MNGKVVLVALFGGIFYAAIASAQAPNTTDAQAPNKSDAGIAPDTTPGPKPYDCDPICRPGFACVDGKCVSPCNPRCGTGEVCTELGHCVQAAVEKPAESAPRASKSESTVIWVWRSESPYWWTPRPLWWYRPHHVWRRPPPPVWRRPPERVRHGEKRKPRHSR